MSSPASDLTAFYLIQDTRPYRATVPESFATIVYSPTPQDAALASYSGRFRLVYYPAVTGSCRLGPAKTLTLVAAGSPCGSSIARQCFPMKFLRRQLLLDEHQFFA